MAYQWFLVVAPEAQKQIDALTRQDRILIFSKLTELLNVDDPTDQSLVTDIKKLKAPEYRGLWRKRAGNWRILYRLEVGEIEFFNFTYKGQLLTVQVVNRRDL